VRGWRRFDRDSKLSKPDCTQPPPEMKILIGALLAAFLAVGTSSLAKASPVGDYPSRPITMTAGANPGGGFDITNRSVVDGADSPFNNLGDVMKALKADAARAALTTAAFFCANV
jgi:tripartite-type tricarboxylate transporter receptor subunit TctC